MPKARPRFRPYNHDQDTLLVANYKEQLQPGTFEHAAHYLIQHKLDLSVFYPRHRNKDTRRRAYDPAILEQVPLVCGERHEAELSRWNTQ